ncbi:MAG: hypothetical protein HZC45_09665 [Deltaproteobacteria bacterium]|nr:hypothetical protein [Deltaproteobacteria bacterium]
MILFILGFLFFLTLAGCSPPPLPPEVELAKRLEHDLWKAEALLYAPEGYKVYQTRLRGTIC